MTVENTKRGDKGQDGRGGEEREEGTGIYQSVTCYVAKPSACALRGQSLCSFSCLCHAAYVGRTTSTSDDVRVTDYEVSCENENVIARRHQTPSHTRPQL